jgi:translation initiation factor IF-1
MAKEELIQFEGLVTEILPDARYRVQLDAGHEIVAYTAGKMKKNRIKTLAGDRVTVEMSPYDLEKGRLIFRQVSHNRRCRVKHDNFMSRLAIVAIANAQKIAHLRIVLRACFK